MHIASSITFVVKLFFQVRFAGLAAFLILTKYVREMVSAVKKPFDKLSDHYTQSSRSLLWRWQRERETRAVDLLLGQVARKEVLDLGFGSGHYTRHLLEKGARHITAVDISSSMSSQLPKSNVTGLVEDATKIRLEKKFSIIICAGLLEFVASPRGVLCSARKLIKNDGHMVCLLPPNDLFGGIYRAYHRRHDFEIILFQKSYFEDLCADSGWTVGVHRFVLPFTDVYRLPPWLEQ